MKHIVEVDDCMVDGDTVLISVPAHIINATLPKELIIELLRMLDE